MPYSTCTTGRIFGRGSIAVCWQRFSKALCTAFCLHSLYKFWLARKNVVLISEPCSPGWVTWTGNSAIDLFWNWLSATWYQRKRMIHITTQKLGEVSSNLHEYETVCLKQIFPCIIPSSLVPKWSWYAKFRSWKAAAWRFRVIVCLSMSYITDGLLRLV